jgi:mRNA-degrading endonuclease RelE of RelBE toxin-antitoxin system
MNEVYETNQFSKLFDAADKQEQEWIEKIKDQLAENLRVGKPLRFDWFREKKLGDKRLFYLVNEHTKRAVLVAFGTKKEQQKIIDHIIANKKRYLELIG